MSVTYIHESVMYHSAHCVPGNSPPPPYQSRVWKGTTKSIIERIHEITLSKTTASDLAIYPIAVDPRNSIRLRFHLLPPSSFSLPFTGLTKGSPIRIHPQKTYFE